MDTGEVHKHAHGDGVVATVGSDFPQMVLRKSKGGRSI